MSRIDHYLSRLQHKFKIEVNYKVLDNDNEYIYLIEMSEKE